ncbi:Sir2 family NAD-dependent protein deacetylase [Pseudomonas syringae pv. actinidiae]|nr:Sir2 family NAD-dependent protein deacetylase [Pseudomonas syringae pv. actinidiae]
MDLQDLNIVALTGAGLSVESGISTYWGKQGSYTKLRDEHGVPIEEIIHPDMLHSDPGLFWRYWRSMLKLIDGALPNEAHHTLARISKMAGSFMELTQNVDGLSLKAGVKTEHHFEIHGNAQSHHCLNCGEVHADATYQQGSYPKCYKCSPIKGQPLRPNMLLYGEDLRSGILDSAVKAASECQILLVIGTELHFLYLFEIIAAARKNDAIVVNINPVPLEGISYYDTLFEVNSRLDVFNIQQTASTGLKHALDLIHTNKLTPSQM